MEEPPVIIPGLKDAALQACGDGNWILVRSILKQYLKDGTAAYEQLMSIEKNDNIIVKSCREGYTSLISVFVTNDFPVMHDIKIKSNISTKMFNLALQSRQLSLVQYLMNHGAKDIENMPSLHWAAKAGHLDTVKFLISMGADINEHCSYLQDTPLHVAVKRCHIDVVKFLLKSGCNVNKKNEFGHTALRYAVSDGNIDHVKLLIEFGADVNDYGLLLWSVIGGHINIIQLLLQSGAMIDHKDSSEGYTPLHVAIFSGLLEVVKYLIDQGADVNLKTSSGFRALYCAINQQRPVYDIIQVLLNAGADSNVVYPNGETVLHEALSSKSQDIIELLLEKGVNVNVRNKYGDTALYKFVFKFHPINIDNRNDCVDDNIINIVGTLIIWGADVRISDNNGNTLLHWAAKNGSVHLVKLLIEHGLDVNTSNINGKKPINLAADAGHHDVVCFFIDYLYKKNVN